MFDIPISISSIIIIVCVPLMLFLLLLLTILVIIALYYGFAPAIFYIGMVTEPCPQSWLEPFNILE